MAQMGGFGRTRWQAKHGLTVVLCDPAACEDIAMAHRCVGEAGGKFTAEYCWSVELEAKDGRKPWMRS